MTKLTTWALLCAFGLVCLFSSCQSSKVAYGNSQYFKQTPRPVAPPTAQEKANLKASLEKMVADKPAVAARMEEARQQLSEVIAKDENTALRASVDRTKQLAREMKSEQLTRKEVRGKRKELRQELRVLAKEFRTASPEQTQDLDQYLKTSLILVAAALLLSIIAAVTVNAGGISVIFGVLGALAWVAALVFFIIWLVEEA